MSVIDRRAIYTMLNKHALFRGRYEFEYVKNTTMTAADSDALTGYLKY